MNFNSPVNKITAHPIVFTLEIVIFITVAVLKSLQFNVLNSGNVYRFEYVENMDSGDTELGTVTCTEAGGGSPLNPAVYMIEDGGMLPFQLNSATGVLTLKTGEILDFEQTEMYTFTVSCSYSSDPSVNAMATIEFSVLPVNEFEPEFDQSITLTVSESTPIGTILVSTNSSGIRQYTVTDRDAGSDGQIRFLQGNDNPPGFALNEETGSLTLTQSIDLDFGDIGLNRLTYAMRPCDGNRPVDDCKTLNVLLILIPTNDNAPTFEQDQYEITISETTPVNTSIISPVCTDADRFTGVYSGITIVPPDAPVYIPDSANGTVILRGHLDYEISSTMTFMLVCRDTGFPVLESQATLLINLLPENDLPPQFNNSLYEFTVSRVTVIGEEIGEVLAIDLDRGDNNQITYTLTGPGNENFQIRGDGTLVLSEFVFAAEGSFFELSVLATDGKFNTSTTVHINVAGVLAIPEIIIVAVSGLLSIVIVIIVVVVCCCCCIGCYRCLPEKRKRSDSAEEMMGMDQLDYLHPVMMPPPSMYDHGGPVYQMAQNLHPQHMSEGWHGSQDLLDTEEGEDEPDIALGSNPSTSRVYTPTALKEMVDIFHEGDKILDGKKKKKDKKQDKK